ncbi:hypothetical protein R1CP_39635 (plasmid) [Rhodococcus opacus]|uniref:HTH lysR-type domain-containing protein n=3 Tax=Rhodococcus TaxID=1827 RepID=A0A1B1KIW4_RHOOP|nr:hypothetical protein R1CP_39635 [Rhodococcus opacus]
MPSGNDVAACSSNESKIEIEHMEIRHLRSFIVVAEELHFSNAARILYVTQPTLTHQIKQLEVDVGAQLLVRTSRKVELTEAGREFLIRSRQILASIDDAADAAARVSRGERGKLAVGFTGTATYELLPKITRRFRKECPDVELVLRGEMLTPALSEALVHRELDVAFLRPPIIAPELEVRVLRSERLGVLVPEWHPLADHRRIDLSLLATEPFVAHPARAGGAMFTVMLQSCLASGFRPNVVQEATETSVIVSLVAAGLGVAVLPMSVGAMQVVGAVLRPLSATTPGIELAVAWRQGDISTVRRRFIEIVDRTLAEEDSPSIDVEGDQLAADHRCDVCEARERHNGGAVLVVGHHRHRRA